MVCMYFIITSLFYFCLFYLIKNFILSKGKTRSKVSATDFGIFYILLA